jgi:protein TonB
LHVSWDGPREPTILAPRRRTLLAVGAGLSLALHAGALLGVLAWKQEADELGVVTEASEAISVELVASPVVEAAQQPHNASPPPAPEPTASVSGSTPSQAAHEKAEEKREAAEEVKPAAPVATSTDEANSAVADDAPRRPEAEPVAEDGTNEPREKASADEARIAKPQEEEAQRETEARADTERESEERDKEARQNAAAGGVTARALTGDGAGAAKASASTGALLEYAAHVRARLAGHKPSGRGRRGVAVVAFGLSPSGEIVYTDVARSSGNPALDRAAVAAVRDAAPFPPPPAGATPAQLQYSIPFKFE